MRRIIHKAPVWVRLKEPGRSSVGFSFKELPKTLCASCKRSTIIEGPSQSAPYVYCHSLDREIRMAVSRCTSYHDAGKPDKESYEKIAWILDTKGGKIVGFVKPGTDKHDKLTED